MNQYTDENEAACQNRVTIQEMAVCNYDSSKKHWLHLRHLSSERITGNDKTPIAMLPFAHQFDNSCFFLHLG